MAQWRTVMLFSGDALNIHDLGHNFESDTAFAARKSTSSILAVIRRWIRLFIWNSDISFVCCYEETGYERVFPTLEFLFVVWTRLLGSFN